MGQVGDVRSRCRMAAAGCCLNVQATGGRSVVGSGAVGAGARWRLHQRQQRKPHTGGAGLCERHRGRWGRGTAWDMVRVVISGNFV